MTKPTKGGKRAGAGRPRLSPDGALRKRRTITVTDVEYDYLREALEYLRANSSAPGQCGSTQSDVPLCFTLAMLVVEYERISFSDYHATPLSRRGRSGADPPAPRPSRAPTTQPPLKDGVCPWLKRGLVLPRVTIWP